MSTFATAYERVTGCPAADVGYGMWLYRDLSIDGMTLIEIAEKLRMMGYPVNDASVGNWIRVSDAVSSLRVLHRNAE